MSFVASNIDYVIDSEGNLEVRLKIPKDLYNNQRIARQVVESLRHVDMISIEMVKHKKSRSLLQNNYLWKLIELISKEQNGVKWQSQQMQVYGQLLVEANVKRGYIRTYEDVAKELESRYRAVVKIPDSKLEDNKGNVTFAYWVYQGSSKFTTKGMKDLLDVAIHYCNELGIEVEREIV